ncbi:MAG: sensor histidine kinase [Telluria sp.]
MHAITNRRPPAISLSNIGLFAVLGVLAFFAMSSTLLLAVSLLSDYLPGVDTEITLKGLRLASIPAAQLFYFGFCLFLIRRAAPVLTSVRYAFLLQLQATVEILYLIACFLVVSGGVYLLAGLAGDPGTQVSIRKWLDSGHTWIVVVILSMGAPAVATVVASYRLSVIRRQPEALSGMINGSFPVRTVVVHCDLADSQSELVRRLERLTSAEMPGLGRLIYGDHPRLTTRKSGELSIHELTWFTCPMKLQLSLRPLESGVQELRIRCLLRAGIYRGHLIATPIDVLAQMRYIESNLVQPFTAELARVSSQRQHDALRDQAIEAQLRILQAQIEPHFLFNTLANVRQLYRTSTAGGESMLDHLIAYLRCAMDDLRAENSSVVKEMDLAMHYLAIMQIRMGERLAYRFSVPETLLDHPMPPAMLISLVENAIKHGLANRDHGEIALSAAVDGAVLRVSVADNGAGFSSVGGTGVGLSNIRQRLEAIYGSRAWLEVGAPEQGGFIATIVIPLEERK